MNRRFFIAGLLVGAFALQMASPVASATGLNTLKISDQAGPGTYKVRLQVDLTQFSQESISANGSQYQVLILPQWYGHTCEPGKPKLPAIRLLLAVPLSSDPALRVLAKEYSVLPEDYEIYPAQEPASEKAPREFVIDESFYKTDVFYPTTLADTRGDGILRDFRVMAVQVFPFQYNPSTKKVRFYSHLVLELQFDKAPATLGESPLFDNAYRGTLLNYNSAKAWPGASAQDSQSQDSGTSGRSGDYDYLFITHDSLYETVQPLVEWKEGKGLQVLVTKTSEIPDTNGNGLDDVDIREHIAEVYHDSHISYVLLVGDVQEIPTHFFDYEHYGNAASDHYYTCIDGNDFYPELCIGRLSAHTTLNLANIVNKTIAYEKHPPSAAWAKKILLVAHPEGAPDPYSFQGCKEDIANDIIPGDYEVFKVYPYEGGTKQDVIDNVNQGRAIVNYRGHGDVDRWDDPAINITDMVTNMTNYTRPTMMFSVSCLTNRIDWNVCLGEAALVSEGSSVAYLGASHEIHGGYGDHFDKYLFRAMFESGITEIGQVVFTAKTNLLSTLVGSEDFVRLFILLGDPECEVGINAPLPPDAPQFRVKNSSDDTVAWFGDLGNLVLKGELTEQQQIETAPEGSFVIATGDDVVGYIENDGDMFIEGTLDSFCTSCDPAGDAFKIQDSSGTTVSYVDFDGNVCLTGGLYQNANP